MKNYDNLELGMYKKVEKLDQPYTHVHANSEYPRW